MDQHSAAANYRIHSKSGFAGLHPLKAPEVHYSKRTCRRLGSCLFMVAQQPAQKIYQIDLTTGLLGSTTALAKQVGQQVATVFKFAATAIIVQVVVCFKERRIILRSIKTNVAVAAVKANFNLNLQLR